MAHRFFVPPACITPPTVHLPSDTARQVRTVLRMRPGNELIVLDNSGAEWQVQLAGVDKTAVWGDIIEKRACQTEPAVEITLFQGTLKAQKFEWVLQKGTELGINRFVPTICRRSVVSDHAALTKKDDRRQRIIQEAAEQSGRGKLPRLESPMHFEAALRFSQTSALRLMPWETAQDDTLKAALAGARPAAVAIFIGPEGGFTPEEAAQAREAGCRIISLGPRILRAETAGLAAAAAVLYELGEWG
jgi:16S rRNA (uracil1498-N3)-methyltransferase